MQIPQKRFIYEVIKVGKGVGKSFWIQGIVVKCFLYEQTNQNIYQLDDGTAIVDLSFENSHKALKRPKEGDYIMVIGKFIGYRIEVDNLKIFQNEPNRVPTWWLECLYMRQLELNNSS